MYYSPKPIGLFTKTYWIIHQNLLDYSPKPIGLFTKTYRISHQNLLDYSLKPIGLFTKTYWIIHQNLLDYSPKPIGLFTKTDWIMHQNRLDYSPKPIGLFTKTYSLSKTQPKGNEFSRPCRRILEFEIETQGTNGLYMPARSTTRMHFYIIKIHMSPAAAQCIQ